MRVKLPSTNSQVVNGAKLEYLMAYPPQALLLDFFDYTGSVATISPRKNRNGVDDYVVAINNVLYEGLHAGTDETLDLTATGLNGLIDGITFVAADGRDFLIWALANDTNTEFDGFAITHKPYSAYTGPAAIGLGATLNVTGLTNAYQFTPGARIVIRNEVGTLPMYEWNWGIVNSIVSSTSINVTMDNNANYGSAITAATAGEIVQWDMFRPWVVGSDQELYSNGYRLIGEISTDTSGNVAAINRSDDPFRSINQTVFYNSTAQTAGITFSIARIIPLWSKSIDAIALVETSSVANGILFRVSSPVNIGGMYFNPQIAARELRTVGRVYLGQDCNLDVRGNSATISDYRVWTYGYYVPGGMRL